MNNLKYFNKENRLKTEKKNHVSNFESLPKQSAILMLNYLIDFSFIYFLDLLYHIIS